jgi:hypothetical protein
MDTRSKTAEMPGRASHAQDAHPSADDDRFAQSLCTACGLCCNGTLFNYVPLTAADDLVPRPTDRVELENGQSGLKQSCRYYSKRLCSIYNAGRPHSCINYRCQVLKRYARDEISLEQALDEIQATVRRINQIKAKMQAQAATPARNLTDLFKIWTTSQGGCYTGWSLDHSAILREYYDLLSHLRRTFGEPGNG